MTTPAVLRSALFQALTEAGKVVLVVPDGTDHRLIDEGVAMTTTRAADYRAMLESGHLKQPAFVTVDAEDLDL